MKSVKKLLAVTLVIAIGLAAFALPSYAVNIYKDKNSSYTSYDNLSTNSSNVVATINDWDTAPAKVGTFPTRPGVILVTSSASVSGIVGHSAIVYDANTIVESVSSGVVTDKNDWNKEKHNVAGSAPGSKQFVAVTVKNTTIQQDAAVAEWCKKQVGKPYNYDFMGMHRRDKFYCSHLIWAGYKDKTGIDLNTISYDYIENKDTPNGVVVIHETIVHTMIGPYEFVPNDNGAGYTFIVYAQNWNGK